MVNYFTVTPWTEPRDNRVDDDQLSTKQKHGVLSRLCTVNRLEQKAPLSRNTSC